MSDDTQFDAFGCVEKILKSPSEYHLSVTEHTAIKFTLERARLSYHAPALTGPLGAVEALRQIIEKGDQESVRIARAALSTLSTLPAPPAPQPIEKIEQLAPQAVPADLREAEQEPQPQERKP